MSAGRRGILLALPFLVAALWLCPGKPAHAQPQRFPQPFQPGVRPQDPRAGKHSIWNSELTPDQIRELLSRFAKGDGDADDPMLELLKQVLRDRNKGATDEQIEVTAKKLMENKEFRDRVMDLAQKHKNRQPNPREDGPPPKLTPEDIAKLARLKPDPAGGDPLKVPEKKFDPRDLPPFDPRNPDFDPKRFPKIDPDNPPKFDPKSKFPIDPDTERPFDPRNGKPIDPENPPVIEPGPRKVDPANPNPMIGPMPPPPVDPKAGQPPEPPRADGNRKFDPDNPLGNPNEPPDARTKAAETATALWEKNVGPIEESPAVKRALIDLVSDPEMMQALTDEKGNNFFDLFDKDKGNGEKFGDWFKGGDGAKWDWPKLELPWGRGRDTDIDVGPSRTREPRWTDSSSRSRGGSSSLDMGSFSIGSMRVPVLLFLVLLALIVALIAWWKWGALFRPKSATFAAGGGGGWPIDPRALNTREDVVKAFEYLSVLICGPGARTWTHSTIADELSELAQSEPDTALKLARLYELARYAPLDEPLTRAELLEARRLVCELAGMDEV